MDSIRTTLKAVANKNLSDKRINVIRYLFSTGRHKKVLILGYSCSDAFDITPQIQSVKENQKEIILVEHSDKEGKTEEIKTKDFKNPFKIFTGTRIICNTDKFIENLWKCLLKEEEYKFITSEAKWVKCVNEWAEGLGQNKGYIKYRIPGLILYSISAFRRAVEYHEKVLEIIKVIGGGKRESTCYTSLGNAYYGLGDFKKAADCYEKSLKIDQAIKDKEGELACYTNLGVAHDHLEDFKKAIEYFEKGLEIEKAIGDMVKKAACYCGLGSAYNGLGDFKKSIENSEKGLKIGEAIGDKEREAKCYLGLGIASNGLENFKGAIEYFEKSLEIAKAIVDKVGEAGSYYGLTEIKKHLYKYR